LPCDRVRDGRWHKLRSQRVSDDKLATYGLDDPEVEGVACHFTVPERGGVKGWLGLAEEVSDISLACRQIGPIASRRSSNWAMTCFGSGAHYSSRRCKLSVGVPHRRFAEEFDLVGADYAMGTERPNPEVR
jgi:hypothetical protein